MLISLLSCLNRRDSVVLWKCDNSILYLNSLDTCIKVPSSLSQYQMSLFIRHQDSFQLDRLRFVISVSSGDSQTRDTIVMPLADSLGCWTGTPYVGAYVNRMNLDIALPPVDSARFSIMPLISDAKEGIDWVAFELEKNE